MHLTFESWHPNRYLKGWKQDPYGLVIDLSEDHLGGEAEEYLVQINKIPSKGSPAEKGEPKTFRVAQHWFYGLQVFKRLERDRDPL